MTKGRVRDAGLPLALLGEMPEPIDADSRLIAQARLDPDAFRGVIERYQDMVYALCLRVLGNQQDAEDATQETFVTLYRHLGDYREGHKVSNWLYTIALNRCRRQMRRRKILKFFSLDFFSREAAGGREPAEPASEERLPEAGLEREESERWARTIVGSLPETLRGVFVLRHLKKMSYQEIAETTKLPMSNVKVRLHRAKRFLWKKFGRTPEGM